MRARKKRKLDGSKRDSTVKPKELRKRLPVPLIRTARPASLTLTNQQIDHILFG